jgi:hypothetical protein
MIDGNAVIYNLLTATGTGLFTLVGSRIYCPHVPVGYANSVTAIEFFRRSGTSMREHETLYPSYQFKCYGGSPNHATAESVYRALCDVLRTAENRCVTGGVVLQTKEEVMGQAMTDPDTGWPSIVTFWQIIMRPTA